MTLSLCHLYDYCRNGQGVEGQLDFSGIETKFQRIFVVETPSEWTIRSVVDELCTRIPELKAKDFSIKEKKETASYGPGSSHLVGGHKVHIERLTIERTSSGKYQIDVEYRRPAIRPFLFIFTCIGLLFGIVPGFIIYFLFHEPETQQVMKTAPALSRFATLLTERPFGGVVHTQIAVEPPPSTPTPLPTTIGDRLKRLDEILAGGAITESEHQQQRARILAEI